MTAKSSYDQPDERRPVSSQGIEQKKEKRELWEIAAHPESIYDIENPTENELLLAFEIKPKLVSHYTDLPDAVQLEVVKKDHTVAKQFTRLAWSVIYYLEAYYPNYLQEDSFMDVLDAFQLKYVYRFNCTAVDWKIGRIRAERKYPDK